MVRWRTFLSQIPYFFTTTGRRAWYGMPHHAFPVPPSWSHTFVFRLEKIARDRFRRMPKKLLGSAKKNGV